MKREPGTTSSGTRRLNGPQTTGRTLRNLSEPEYSIQLTPDVDVVVRDGTTLRADVYRPAKRDPSPALLAFSCYPRQIQNSGAPLGFVEAGASDFWVSRGYVHVIANSRGTGGSGGTYSWLDKTEREDIADLVEWTAAQDWCDGNVGMIGISYFAMAQLAGAIEAPEHLKAIFPVATTGDIYEAAWHNGLLSSTFISAWISGVATLAQRGDGFFRNSFIDTASRVLRSAPVHKRFEHLNGEAALSALGVVMRAHFPQEPWGDLLTDVTVNHQLRDEWWEERNLEALIEGSTIPTYLGCDWENVPLHLPSTFKLWEVLRKTAPLRVGMLGAGGLTWPWESLHTEALGWFDHWLKGIDTGIMDGPEIRYWLPGADEFHSATQWPPVGSELHDYWLRDDGELSSHEPPIGSASFEFLPTNLSLPKGAPPPRHPGFLSWQTQPLIDDIDVVGDCELVMDASITATDASWIVTLQDVSADGSTVDVTAGWLRAALREVDEQASVPGAPKLRCETAVAVQPGEQTRYRIPLIATARRFARGHRIRLVVASDDQAAQTPAIMGFHHQISGMQSTNTVWSSSMLRLCVLPHPVQ